MIKDTLDSKSSLGVNFANLIRAGICMFWISSLNRGKVWFFRSSYILNEGKSWRAEERRGFWKIRIFVVRKGRSVLIRNACKVTFLNISTIRIRKSERFELEFLNFTWRFRGLKWDSNSCSMCTKMIRRYVVLWHQNLVCRFFEY